LTGSAPECCSVVEGWAARAPVPGLNPALLERVGEDPRTRRRDHGRPRRRSCPQPSRAAHRRRSSARVDGGTGSIRRSRAARSGEPASICIAARHACSTPRARSSTERPHQDPVSRSFGHGRTPAMRVTLSALPRADNAPALAPLRRRVSNSLPGAHGGHEARVSGTPGPPGPHAGAGAARGWTGEPCARRAATHQRSRSPCQSRWANTP